MRQAIMVALFIAWGGVAHAQTVIEADFIETVTRKSDGATRTITGTHYFSMAGDGAYRVDFRFADGERTSEIWRPDLQERITINHTLGVAQRGDWTRLWDVPTRSVRGWRRRLLPMTRLSGAGDAGSQSQLGPDGSVPSTAAGEPGLSLRSRAVGPLLLMGSRFEDDNSDIWSVEPFTIPGLAVLPVLEEYEDTPRFRIEMRLTSVTRVASTPDLFDVPSGLPVERLSDRPKPTVR